MHHDMCAFDYVCIRLCEHFTICAFDKVRRPLSHLRALLANLQCNLLIMALLRCSHNFINNNSFYSKLFRLICSVHSNAHFNSSTYLTPVHRDQIIGMLLVKQKQAIAAIHFEVPQSTVSVFTCWEQNTVREN